MSTKPKSRWDTTPDTPAELARIKADKDAKKKAKERRKAEAAALEAVRRQQEEHTATQDLTGSPPAPTSSNGAPPPLKRRKLDEDSAADAPRGGYRLLRLPAREIAPCRSVENYDLLNHIEEGSYGIVSRAKDLLTGEVVALKKLKLERERDGFPITSLREIQTLMTARHRHVVNIREVVVGEKLDQ